jgi:uncharacterized protein
MIKQGEIQNISNRQKIRDTQIEKDYVITWVLLGISKNQFLANNLIFKGGTALKKCYYPDYRFSEDLDFTFSGESFDHFQLLAEFANIFAWIYEESRIKLQVKENNELTTGNTNFYAGFIGPLGGDGTKKDIKIDIGQDEKIYFEPILKNVFANYSDLDDLFTIKCYKLEEVVSEKMRSLMQRTIPRDLYDLWYILEVEGMDIEDCIFSFQAKTTYKNLNPNDFVNKVMVKKDIFKAQWVKSLSHQITILPNFDEVWRDFNKHLRKFTKFI